MEPTPLIAAAGILFFTGASFFFSLAETALFSLSKWQVRQLAERQPHLGGIVTRLLGSPQDLIASIALGFPGLLAPADDPARPARVHARRR
jgi:CBS domain containing-hemolysin-like protein